ncbi:MAG: hypothetical protein PHI18_00545 [bacterium]|nr:hypothetical protein [bacterium]
MIWLILCLLAIVVFIVVKVVDRRTVKNISYLLLALLLIFLLFGVFICQRANGHPASSASAADFLARRQLHTAVCFVGAG